MSTHTETPEVGTIEQRQDGEWVVIGPSFGAGPHGVSAVRRDSLAHRVIAQRDPRVAAALTGERT